MSNIILHCGKVWYICVLFTIKLNTMSKQRKPVQVTIDLSVLVDLTQATQILFNMVKDKDLSIEEVENLQTVGDLMQASSKKFENAINATSNDR